MDRSGRNGVGSNLGGAEATVDRSTLHIPLIHYPTTTLSQEPALLSSGEAKFSKHIEMSFLRLRIIVVSVTLAIFALISTVGTEALVVGLDACAGRESPSPIEMTPDSNNSDTIIIDFTSRTSANKTIVLLEYFLNDTSINAAIHSIRHVSVSGLNSYGNWSLLTTLFERFSQLSTVHWDAYEFIPVSILQSMNKHSPSAKLFYTIRFYPGDHHSYHFKNDDNVQENKSDVSSDLHDPKSSILNSTNLYALKMEISYDGGTDNFDPMELLWGILTSCHRLRQLDLELKHSGCVVGGRSPWAFDFLSHPHSRFPPLEVLKIKGYEFDERSDGGIEWDYRRGKVDWEALYNEILNDGEWPDDKPLPRPERRKSDGRTNIEAWMSAMSWRHLHTLDISNPSNETLKRLSGKTLVALRSLTLRGGWKGNVDGILEFIRGTEEGLSELELRDLRVPTKELVDVVAEKQGDHLEYLALGVKENDHFLSASEIGTLLVSCPRLRKLDIAIPRSVANEDGWNFTYFNAMTRIRALQHLIIRFPSPDVAGTELVGYQWAQYKINGDASDVQDPLINKMSTEQLFTYLRKKKEGTELVKLDVYVGDWDNRMEIESIIPPEQLRVAFYECRVNGTEETCVGTQTRLAN